MEFLGNQTGGRYFPVKKIRPGMLMFTFGVGEDISFELEMIRLGVKVICFDPTPKSIEYMKRYPDIEFHPVGLSDTSGIKRFYYPKDPTHVSCSIDNLQGTTEYFEAECMKLTHVIDTFGDPDIIKMDIEGAEYRVIDEIIDWPEILMVEFHGKRENEYTDILGDVYRNVYRYGHDYLAL